jgi:very-short-patch-repair endonuclease
MKSRTKDRALDIVEQGAAEAAQDIRNFYEYASEKCESPIERILVAEFVRPWTGQAFDMRCDVLAPPSGSIEYVEAPPLEGVYLWPQIKIGQYRVDFVAGVYRPGKPTSYAIVECDGHDFHEKTKEQAQRDKARDRYLAAQGYRVLRYTGSEIYRNPTIIWDEIIKILLGFCD